MKHRDLILSNSKKNYRRILRSSIIGISILILLVPLSSANSSINKDVIKEKYHPDTKSFEIFDANLEDMDLLKTAENLEKISKKYNVDINTSENFAETNNDISNEDIIAQSPGEEKILLISLSGKVTIKDIIDFYKSGINLYYPASKNTVIVRIKAGNITKLKSYPFINGVREYKPNDKINPDDKIRIDQIIQSNKNASHQSESLLKIYIWPLGKENGTYTQDLQQLGIEKIIYDNTAKVYYTEALPSKINSILNLKWVKKIDLQKKAALHSLPAEGFEPDDSRELINAPLVWPSYIGNNATVGVLDTGIWNNHTDFAGGIIHSVPDNDGHGTHVSGIIASRGTRDIEGQYDGKGIAYGASLFVLDDIGNLTQFNVFKNNLVNIFSNSWGYCISDPITGECIEGDFSYNGDTEIVDSYVANNGTTIIFSAGNEGSGQETITNPGTAKM